MRKGYARLWGLFAALLLSAFFVLSAGAVTWEGAEAETENSEEAETKNSEEAETKNSEEAETEIAEETVGEDALASFYDPDAVEAWFRERVLPNLTSTVLIIGVGLLELIPAIRSLLRARGAFRKAASDVEAYTEAKIEYDARAEEREKKFLERLDKYDEEIARAREETRLAAERFEEIAKSYAGLLRESEARLGDTLHHVETSAKKTEEMVFLGMSNSCELVQNGAARKIAEVEERAEDGDTD